MKLYQNSVTTVLFSTKEGKRNGNDKKTPMNPDAPDKPRSGFCILREGRGAHWNAGADPLLSGQEARLLWSLADRPQHIVCFGLDF